MQNITQGDLHRLRSVAEKAWRDETRSDEHRGHPSLFRGQDYVTSKWLTEKLGGHVGLKDDHYFWVSPEREFVIDLTGDFNRSGDKPGPILYKHASHPLFKGFRVVEPVENEHTKLFSTLANETADQIKLADLAGSDPYPAEESQAANDSDQIAWDNKPYYPGSYEYNFVYGNGELHLSPTHDHKDLLEHADIAEDHTGPIAVGHAYIEDNHVAWEVESNIAITGLIRTLKDYSKQAGWKWDGIVSNGERLDGEGFDIASSLWYRFKDNLELSSVPFEDIGAQSDGEVQIRGKFAKQIVGWGINNPTVREALQEWADDFGYKLAEYPGGTNMNDRLKKLPDGEDYEQFNFGNPSPVENTDLKDDRQPNGTFKCPNCSGLFGSWSSYVRHRRDEDVLPKELPQEDGKFPELPDMDKPLPNNFIDRQPFVFPLASWKEASVHEEYVEDWYNNALQHWGAYQDGKLVGFASIDDNNLVVKLAGSFSAKLAITRKIYSQGQHPKDLIKAEIPFIYDIDEDVIALGHPGTRHSDVPGKFTPGGIIEGTYEPGGRVVIRSLTNTPYSIRHIIDLWYWSHPHMEITNLELEDAEGNTTKLASRTSATDVGSYIKTLVMTDSAAYNAFQALSKIGGDVYVVGGAIRDALLQQEPKDLDLLVQGISSERVRKTLESLPGKVDITGKDFGVFRYRHKGDEVEIALPRTEKSTGDRRVDFDVQVDHKLPIEDDLLRRDFTANSMAVSLKTGKLVDPYKGADDIESRVLRTTHPNSFEEDPTRLVRALVASSRHGLVPDERTRREIEENASRLQGESRERIQAELDKLFQSRNPAGAIRLAQDTGMLKHLFPEVSDNFDYDQNNPHHNLPLGQHLLQVLENVQSKTDDPDLRMAALLHDIGKPASRWDDPVTGRSHYYRGPNGLGDNHDEVGARLAETRLRNLKWPTARIKRIHHLITHHMWPAFSSEKGARKFLNRVGDDHANDLMILRWADQRGKGQSEEQLNDRTHIDHQRGLVDGVRTNQQATNLTGMAINGNDLIQLGLKPGPEVGQVLRSLLDDIVADPHLNDRDTLLQRAQEYINGLPQ